MRVLLKEGADQVTPASILVVEPELTETTLETLSGEAVLDGGIVAEVDNSALADVIDAAAEERAAQSIAAERPIEEVAWMASILAPYEAGSRIAQHITARYVLDATKAKRTGPISRSRPRSGATLRKPTIAATTALSPAALVDSAMRGTRPPRISSSCSGAPNPALGIGGA